MTIKQLGLLMAACYLTACGDQAPAPVKEQQAAAPMAATPTTADTAIRWIDSFKGFRDALYQQNKKKVKEYVDFPIVTENNDIWFHVYKGDDDRINTRREDAPPFTEQDFDKHFNALFSKQFINCLLKVKSEELYKKGEIQTPEINDDGTIYTLFAEVSEAQELTLSLSSQTPSTNADGEAENVEFAEVFVFAITPNGKIKFKKVMLAG